MHGLMMDTQLLVSSILRHAERNFGDGTTRFEATHAAEHHDHLICTSCGTILEFEDPKIEQLQRQVAEHHGFSISSHRLELYGFCANCRDD